LVQTSSAVVDVWRRPHKLAVWFVTPFDRK